MDNQTEMDKPTDNGPIGTPGDRTRCWVLYSAKHGGFLVKFAPRRTKSGATMQPVINSDPFYSDAKTGDFVKYADAQCASGMDELLTELNTAKAWCSGIQKEDIEAFKPMMVIR